MTTLYDIGDTIEISVHGIVKEFSVGENGDCYVIEIPSDSRMISKDRVYMDGHVLKANSKLIKSANKNNKEG